MTIQINTDDFNNLADRLNPRIRKAQKIMANQALLEMNRYVPKKEGTLRQSGAVAQDGSYIKWNTVYAHYQYEGISKLGKTKWNYTDPDGLGLVGPHWDEKVKADKVAMEHITKAFKNNF